MAEHAATPSPQSKAVEEILGVAKRAFDPSANVQDRESQLQEYNDLIARTETWILLPILNSLIKPNVLPEWLREPLMRTLTMLPLRPDGVRGTMEFVFSVHPSNHAAASESQQPQKGGAGITHEAVAVATRLLSTVPASMAPDAWYRGISTQLFNLFDGEAGPELSKTAAQIVGFGILGRKQMGAPGAPGWNSFVQPLLERINPSLRDTNSRTEALKQGQDEDIIDLSRDKILVSGSSLEEAIKRLKVLILSNPSPGLCRRVLKPVLLQLWALNSWSNPSSDITSKFCTPARSLLRTYLRLFGKIENISPIIGNILCKGPDDESSGAWQFKASEMAGIDIVASLRPRPDGQGDIEFTEIESKADVFVNIITETCSNEEVSSLFLCLLQRWIYVLETQSSTKIKTSADEQTSTSPIQNLVEVSILQRFMELSPEKLIGQFDQLIDVICQVLEADNRASLDDDLVSVVLSLLNLVITSPSFQRSDIKAPQLQLVESSLDRIGSSDRRDVADTAKNLSLLLKYRDEIDPTEQKQSSQAPSVRQIEDRRVYNLAMSYITGDSDNPPPVVSEGLNMLSTLILAESPILDITAVTVLMSNLLKNNEDYINLRVVKLFTQIADKHPKSTTRELLDNYLDAQEKLSTDIRLRFGEALVQVIEKLGETFTGDVATQTAETLLSIAGRRGYRPKTMAKQAREERLEQLKSAKAGRSNAGEEDETAMDESEDMTEAERANNDMLTQIIQGWESKRGSEDIRMRTSALSIFGVGLEVNIVGIGATLVTNAIDLCVNVLTIEREAECGILRRAAIICILNFVGALDEAKQSGRSLGFGLTDQSREDISRTLNYVADTDTDGLVQQHARDVVESLENWHMGSLITQPSRDSVATSGIARLAGLRVNPNISPGGNTEQPRPRIEEVE